MTDEMLEVARRNVHRLSPQRIGYANVEFRKGRIQDLALDLESVRSRTEAQPDHRRCLVSGCRRARRRTALRHPLIASDSVDVVVSNCVLNLVEPKSKRQLFDEIFASLKRVGAR